MIKCWKSYYYCRHELQESDDETVHFNNWTIWYQELFAEPDREVDFSFLSLFIDSDYDINKFVREYYSPTTVDYVVNLHAPETDMHFDYPKDCLHARVLQRENIKATNSNPYRYANKKR